MTRMYVRHKVSDFAKWKPIFDEHGKVRKQFGCISDEVFVHHGNPNDVLIILEWNNKEDALSFRQSPDLKEAMQRAGVVSEPEITFAE